MLQVRQAVAEALKVKRTSQAPAERIPGVPLPVPFDGLRLPKSTGGKCCFVWQWHFHPAQRCRAPMNLCRVKLIRRRRYHTVRVQLKQAERFTLEDEHGQCVSWWSIHIRSRFVMITCPVMKID